jgi:hypothetical protein
MNKRFHAASTRTLVATVLLACGMARWSHAAPLPPPADVEALPKELVLDREKLVQINDVDVLSYVLLRVRTSSRQLLMKHARKDVSYSQLIDDPDTHFGELVHVEGILVRLRRLPAGDSLRKAGILHEYEAWIVTVHPFGSSSGAVSPWR